MTVTDGAIDRSAHTEAGLTVLRGSAHTIAKLTGDLDIATAPALRERLTALLRPGMGLLILDLSGVAFCDAAGLAVLIGTQRRAASLGVTVSLAAPRLQVSRVLRITGLDRSLPVHTTPAAALSALSALSRLRRVPPARAAR